MTKRIISLILSVLLLAGVASFGEETASYPEYLNLDSYHNLISEGTDIKLKAIAYHDGMPATDDLNDAWFWQYVRNYMNLDVTLERLDATNKDERKNLIFAGNDVPDMMFALGFTTSELMNYGIINKQLMPLEDYISPELTPGLNLLFETYPDVKAACTAPDGHMYTLPFVYGMDEENPTTNDNFASYRTFINSRWLEEMGLENPETLDELLAVLRAFKTRGDDVIPLTTNSNLAPLLMPAVMCAWGVVVNTLGDQPAVEPALTIDGEVVIPAMTDAYKEYLSFLRTCYEEELISPDFFTMSEEQVRAIIAEDRAGVIADYAPYLSFGWSSEVPPAVREWITLNPMKVNKEDKVLVYRGNAYQIGGFAMGANCKYPEVAMRFVDYFFTPEGYAETQNGVLETETEKTMGLIKGLRVYWNEKNQFWGLQAGELLDGEWDTQSGYSFVTAKIYPFNLTLGWSRGATKVMRARAELEPMNTEWKDVDMQDTDSYYRYTMYLATKDCLTAGYSSYVYLTEEESIEITDTLAMAKGHVQAETAKFVTGARSLDDFDAFVEELNDMGMDRYLEIYTNTYKASNAE